jgi:hypothetical protein
MINNKSADTLKIFELLMVMPLILFIYLDFFHYSNDNFQLQIKRFEAIAEYAKQDVLSRLPIENERRDSIAENVKKLVLKRLINP